MLNQLTVLFVILATLFCVEARPSGAGPPPQYNICLAAHGISGTPDTSQLGDSPDVPRDTQCMVKCYLQVIGLLKNGKVLMQNALNYYDDFDGTQSELTTALEECDAIGSDDSCDTAMRIALCLRKLNQKRQS